MLSLMQRIFCMPFPWNVWVMLLGLVNMVGGIYFFATLEGKFALAAMMGAMMVMWVIYAKYGFVRLLGLGHILFWVPFLIWSVLRLRSWNDLPTDFRFWLVLVSILNSLSLVVDFIDVWRYAKGEKKDM
ncbi:MAG: hypothetical protein AB7H48_08695 [Parachlamydiales bacterium]